MIIKALILVLASYSGLILGVQNPHRYMHDIVDLLFSYYAKFVTQIVLLQIRIIVNRDNVVCVLMNETWKFLS